MDNKVHKIFHYLKRTNDTSTILDQMLVNIIGYGYVGSAMGFLCKQNDIPFCTYDVNMKDDSAAVQNFDDISQLIQYSEQYAQQHSEQPSQNVYFICVPTPNSESGECDIGIVDSVLQHITHNATMPSCVFIKSTVKPGTCKYLTTKYNTNTLNSLVKIVYCPEFLKEATFKEDMYNSPFVLLGSDVPTQSLSLQYIETNFEIGVMKQLYKHNKNINVVLRSFEQCEIFKYTINVFLSVKVWFFNEIELLCQKFDVDYQHLKQLFCLDPRLGNSHIDVPGPDGERGFGGKCLPKETKALRHLQETLGIDHNVLDYILERNDVFRNPPLTSNL
jgi:nucleotide sugar dehydrogenase